MRKFFRRFRLVFKFWKSIPFVRDFFLSNEVEIYIKVLSGILIVGYALFPFDIIPDFILLLGIFDDVVVIGFIVERMMKWAPSSLKEKYRIPRNE